MARLWRICFLFSGLLFVTSAQEAREISVPKTSTSNAITITTITAKSPGSNDTKAVLDRTSCGGSLTGRNGTFHSPNFPEDYDNGLHCAWSITAPSDDQKILLSFTNFSTESCCDLVTVFDGPTSISMILLLVSGPDIPQPVMTTGPHCFVTFKTDWVESSSGWKAIFTSVPSKTPAEEESIIVQSQSSVSSSSYPISTPKSTINTPKSITINDPESTIKSITPERNASPSLIPLISTASLTMLAFMLLDITRQMMIY